MSVVEETSVAEILEKATSGERITDEDAIELLRSRDLVAVGRAANDIRNRLHDPERVTFIIDRNLNYTNVCVTDCDFCAFYRRPGDRREGYLLPKAVIFKKIEETLALGGTGLLMQGSNIGALLGPPITATLVSSGGWPAAAWLTSTALAVVAASGVFLHRRERRRLAA